MESNKPIGKINVSIAETIRKFEASLADARRYLASLSNPAPTKRK